MLLSTEAEIRDRVRGLTTGADEYVGKPYDPSLRGRARPRAGSPQRRRPHRRTRRRVLVIDDSVTFREALKTALEQASYRVIVADSGEDGLRLASDQRPTAIVVDGQLPGIDGATVIRRIRLDAALRGTAVPAAHRRRRIAAPRFTRSMPAPTPSCARTRTSPSSSPG